MHMQSLHTGVHVRGQPLDYGGGGGYTYIYRLSFHHALWPFINFSISFVYTNFNMVIHLLRLLELLLGVGRVKRNLRGWERARGT